MERPIGDILNDAQAIAAAARRATPIIVAPATACSIAEAHFRAECEQRPVPAGNVTVYPIGIRPA